MKMFPKPPTSAIDWSSIGFQSFDQTSHIESVWSQETEEWSEPRIVRDPWVKVHGLSPALNYGQQCYEGMRACRSSDDQIVLFRPREHAKRMVRSASVVSIPPVPEEIFMLCVQAAVIHNSEFVPPHNGRAALYIRPVVFGSGPQLMLAPPAEFTFCVFVHPAPAMHGEDALDAIVLEDFDRAAPRGVGHAKVGGNYAPVMKWSSKAQEDGFMLTLHLDSATRTEIDEFSSCAFAGIKTCEGRTTLVVPDSPSIVESITADSCMEIARRLGWMVERRRVMWEEVQNFDDVIAMGTATLLVPVRSVTRRSTKQTIVFCAEDATPGKAFEILRAAMNDIVFAIKDGPPGWMVPVQPAQSHVQTEGTEALASCSGAGSKEKARL